MAEEMITKEEGLIKNNCDKYDFIIAACCGGLAGIIDVIFVGDPSSSKIGDAVDNAADGFVKKAAQFFWKNDKRSTKDGKSKHMPESLNQCINYLEQAFPVNYDARYAKDLNVAEGVLDGMGPRNHHLYSLAHSPDIIGLIFSIIDQFSEDGSASFIDKGHIIHVVPKKTSGAVPYAKANAAITTETIEELENGVMQCIAIRRRTYLFYSLLARMDAYFLPQIYLMEKIISEEGVDYSQFRPESKKSIAIAASTAATIKGILDTPILTEAGNLTVASGTLLEETKERLDC